MGFNLLTRAGWRNLWISRRHWRQHLGKAMSDTFRAAVCKIRGHKPYNASDSCRYIELACRRCRFYINHKNGRTVQGPEDCIILWDEKEIG